ncbi:sigma-70 family RNA polymerase sigma factor [Clostridium sp. DL1XJH146]
MNDKIYDYKNLSNEELFNIYKEDEDKIAKEYLIINNLPLVKKIAYKNYNNSSLSYEDLVQEGIIGLIYGIDKYDLTYGTKFSTYAYYWIQEVVDRSIYNKGQNIRFPMYIIEKMNKIAKLENNDNYSIDSICTELNITQNQYFMLKYYFKYLKNVISLNEFIKDCNRDSEAELIEFVSEEKAVYYEDNASEGDSSVETTVMNKLLKKEIDTLLSILSPREETILRLRFGLDDDHPRTLEEIGNLFNLTRERIRQIESKALRKLRHPSHSKKIKEYL